MIIKNQPEFIKDKSSRPSGLHNLMEYIRENSMGVVLLFNKAFVRVCAGIIDEQDHFGLGGNTVRWIYKLWNCHIHKVLINAW